jgi:hypothetical protein
MLSRALESASDFGLYFTFTLKLPPAGTVAGSVPASAVKELSDRFSFSICTEDVPLFVMRSFWFALFPTPTSPNSTEDGLIASPAVLLLENGFVYTPPQPDKVAAAHPVKSASAPRRATLDLHKKNGRKEIVESIVLRLIRGLRLCCLGCCATSSRPILGRT